MTQATCPTCRLRFARDSAALLEECPQCTQPLVRTADAHAALGYRLFDFADLRSARPADSGFAAAVAPPHERV